MSGAGLIAAICIGWLAVIGLVWCCFQIAEALT